MTRFHREVSSVEFKSVMAGLQGAGYQLILTSANRAYFGALGVDPTTVLPGATSLVSNSNKYEEGDLIPTENWNEVVYIGLRQEFARGKRGRPRQKHYLEVGSISRTCASNLLQPVKDLVLRALKAEEGPKVWLGRIWINQKFDALAGQGAFAKGSDPTNEIRIAEALSDRNAWKLAVAVKAAGSMLLKDFLRVGGSEDDISRLASLQLLRKEQVLICKRTSNLLNRLASIDVLKDLDERGVVCASCGRKLFEYHEEGEEVDAFVDVDGSLLLVELKDKEFSMGHAYPLPGRIAMYHPDYTLIVTTERVAKEVRDYFERIKPETQMLYAEGLDLLQVFLENVVDSARAKKAKTLLERFNPLTIGVDIPALVGAKLGIRIPPNEKSMPFSL